MKTGILVWLAFSVFMTSSKWAASGRLRTTLAISLAITTLTWLMSDRISEISDKEIRAFIDQDIVRNSILGLVTIESVCVSLILWKSMRDGRSGLSGKIFDVLTITPSLAFMPATVLAVHEVISKWNSVDFGVAAILTSFATCWTAWILAIVIRRILREDVTRIELAALVTISFLPWSAVVMAWARFSIGSYVPAPIAIASSEATPAFWAMAFGLLALGFMVRRFLDIIQERRLG